MTDKYAVVATQINTTELDKGQEIDLIPDNIFIDMPTDFPGFDNLKDVLIDLKDRFYEEYEKTQNITANGDSSDNLGPWVTVAEFTTSALPDGRYSFEVRNIVRLESDRSEDCVEIDWDVDGQNIADETYLTLQGGQTAVDEGLRTRLPFYFKGSLDLTGTAIRNVRCRVRVRGRTNTAAQVRYSAVEIERKG